MPVFLFTFHAYRSWMPDHPRGWVKRGRAGILAPNQPMASSYRRQAAHAAVEFNPSMQNMIIAAARHACDRHSWRLHQVVAIASHVHPLVSWRTDETCRHVMHRLKRLLGAAISTAQDRPGPWFSRGSGYTQVKDRAHFLHLMNVYLPEHHGTFWREDA